MSSDRNGRVAGVVLAAGASTRMGRNKLFLEIAGEPLLHRAVRRAIDSGLDPVIVVVGHERERAIDTVAELYCSTVVNPDFQEGISSSVRAGVAAVPPDVDAAVVILADMPLVSEGMIAALVMRYREERARLVVSSYGDVTAPPTLYDRSLFAELLGAAGHAAPMRETGAGDAAQGCGKRVVRRHLDEASFVAWPAELVADLDLPGDFERVKALIEEGSHQHAR
jgi:molybdenum cofactor cytidylyltransferase